MNSNPENYKEGDVVNLYHKGPKGSFVAKVTIQENCCRKVFERMIFFKYNLTPNDYRSVKIAGENGKKD